MKTFNIAAPLNLSNDHTDGSMKYFFPCNGIHTPRIPNRIKFHEISMRLWARTYRNAPVQTPITESSDQNPMFLNWILKYFRPAAITIGISTFLVLVNFSH